MKTAPPEQVLTANLRERLKTIMQKEIERLPETLEALEPRERVNVLCKILPFVFPKVDSVSMDVGEPW